jgi:hypothetical protein
LTLFAKLLVERMPCKKLFAVFILRTSAWYFYFFWSWRWKQIS